MLDLTLIADALRLFALIYWGFAIAAIYFALTKPKALSAKILWTLGAVALFGFVPASNIYRHQVVDKPIRDAQEAKLKLAMQQFEMRCKSAGEKITRTVDNVDGIVWMKWRTSGIDHNDQFNLDDPYGKDCKEEACIEDLLRVTQGMDLNPEEAARHTSGYRFVETVSPSDSQSYRYTGIIDLPWSTEEVERHLKDTGQPPPAFSHRFRSTHSAIPKLTARYGITWDDISTKEDRERWIAGGSLKVIDLQTNEVIAERIGYMMDKGQGSTAGFRSPWLEAIQTACPEFPHGPNDLRHGRTLHETRDFLLKILKPGNPP